MKDIARMTVVQKLNLISNILYSNDLSLKYRLTMAGKNLLKAYDKHFGADLSSVSWETENYVMCTGESASNLLRFRYDIVALQIDCDGWDILQVLPGTLNEFRAKICMQSKKLLPKMIVDCDNQSDIPAKLYKFVQSSPWLGLKIHSTYGKL